MKLLALSDVQEPHKDLLCTFMNVKCYVLKVSEIPKDFILIKSFNSVSHLAYFAITIFEAKIQLAHIAKIYPEKPCQDLLHVVLGSLERIFVRC